MFERAIFDGAPVDVRDLRLDSFVNGYFFGAGVFETLRVREGEPEFLERHLVRMARSLQALPAIAAPARELLHPALVRRHARRALARSPEVRGPFNGVMKITASDGHVLVTFREMPARRDAVIDEVVSSYRSGDTLLNHKSLAYLRQLGQMGRPVLFANERAEVCEGPTANLFVLLDDTIVTPPLEAPCLPGIVREVVLERGRLDDLSLVERPVRVDQLPRARACVLTNSLSIATPVVRLLGRDLEASLELAERFRRAVESTTDRFPPKRDQERDDESDDE